METPPKISAMYYVKNEEEFAPYSILSIYNVVDEIVVVDNGSTDRTRERLSEFDKVCWFEYQTEDFSELANFALSKCRGDWILKIDGDEVFYRDIEEVLPVLTEYDQIDAYTCRFFHLNFGLDSMQNVSDDDGRFQRIFLFQNRPGRKFINPLHESLIGLGPAIADSGLHYVHYGYTKPMEFILDKLKQYASKMGDPYFYEGRTANHLLEQAERTPFPYEHPEVIKEYIKQKGYSGGTPKPPKDMQQLRHYLDHIVASKHTKVEEKQEKQGNSLEIGALPNCISPGFEHLDLRPLPYVDIVGDIRNIPVEDNTYEQVIVPGYLLEHLPYHDIGKALRECFRITKEGGKVYVRIYDGLKIAEAYAAGEINNESFNKLLFGGDREGWERHRCVLDRVILRKMMEMTGLKVDMEYNQHWIIELGGTKYTHFSELG
ncbi:glycosyltransferase [Effusibacillus consociatus]|uniref:Glycosyltransferase n=1 Tax=Effusibacillus consociatus TaxID=1117041 RepID=A0ABV9Q4J2_9BACL